MSDQTLGDQTFRGVRDLSRDNLEDLAIRAILQIRQDKQERSKNEAFLSVLTGFMLGLLIVAGAFLTGSAFR